MVTQLKGKPRCPELKRIMDYWGLDKCELNDKPCVLEFGYTCSYYENYLKEIKEEEKM